MINLIKVLLIAILNILPNSPFQSMLSDSEKFDFLPYLNWFVPFDNALKLTNLWLVCVLVYYNWGFIKAIFKKYIGSKL